MAQVLFTDKTQDPVKILAGGVAHDFSSLLTNAKGRILFMLRSIPPHDPLYLQMLQLAETIDKGADIAKQLMDISDTGDFHMTFFDINPLIEKLITHRELKRKIHLDIDLDSTPLIIKADVEKIKQVLLNIITNAVQAMPGRKKLSIITESVRMVNGSAAAFRLAPGLYAKITIVDYGNGMSQETLESIFEPFFSIRQARYPDKKGTGLTIARDIVHRHGGAIDVWSSPGVGSSFSIILPIQGTDQNQNDLFEEECLNIRKKTILFVDDEEMILTVGEELCKKLGYQVITALSGKEALDIYRADKDSIDLVISDLVMPRMDGVALFKELKKVDPSVNVLVSTGYSSGEKIQEMIDQGCRGILSKPYGLEEISFEIERVLAANPV